MQVRIGGDNLGGGVAAEVDQRKKSPTLKVANVKVTGTSKDNAGGKYASVAANRTWLTATSGV